MKKVLAALLMVVFLASVLMAQTSVTGAGSWQLFSEYHRAGLNAALTKNVWVKVPAGIYRVTCLNRVTTNGASGNIDLNIFFLTPSSGSEINFSAFVRVGGAAGMNTYGTAGGVNSATLTFEANPGTNVQISTTLGSTGAVHNVDCYMERK